MPSKKLAERPSVARGALALALQADPAALPKPSESEAKTLANRTGLGPSAKKVWFAWHLARGIAARDAYIAAGYLIQGANAPLGASAALTEEAATARLETWCRSHWLAKLHAGWKVSVLDRVLMEAPESLSLIRQMMAALKGDGSPDANIRLQAAAIQTGLLTRLKKLELEERKLAWDQHWQRVLRRDRKRGMLEPLAVEVLDDPALAEATAQAMQVLQATYCQPQQISPVSDT